MNVRPVRVLLPEDRELVLHGLRGMLARYRDRIEIIETGGPEPPDLEIVDVSGAEAAEALSGINGNGTRRWVALVDRDAPAGLVGEALAHGASGLLVTSEPADVLADALVRAASGSAVLSRSLETVVAAARRQRWPGEDRGLSRRESQVLVLIAAGRTPEEVASTLGIAHETVRSHLKRVYHKLGVRDRATAVARAWNEGIVDRQTVTKGDPPARPAPASVGLGGAR